MTNRSFQLSNVPVSCQNSSKEETPQTARPDDGRKFEFWPDH